MYKIVIIFTGNVVCAGRKLPNLQRGLAVRVVRSVLVATVQRRGL